MHASTIHSISLAATFALAGCGGGGGGAINPVNPTPPPAPPPPQSSAIIPAATTSQEFAVIGASRQHEGDQTPRLGADEQLQVRYVASSNSYEVQLPHSSTWKAIALLPTDPTSPVQYQGESIAVYLRSAGQQYSRLIEWSDGESIFGVEAVGIATAAGNVPTTGSASYAGPILGFTSEQHDGIDEISISGSITMDFDFGSGSLSGNINPILNQDFAEHPLDTIAFRNTVYSVGSTTFAGEFDTDLPGMNSFSGLFTGPNAEELIGNFAVPYESPIDSQTYQAAGAFVAN